MGGNEESRQTSKSAAGANRFYCVRDRAESSSPDGGGGMIAYCDSESASSHMLLQSEFVVAVPDGAEDPQEASAMAVGMTIYGDDEAKCLHRRSAVVVFER